MKNIDRFTNDRKEALYGVSSGTANDKLIYWSRPICKIIDTNPEGGTQIGTSGRYEHPFYKLNEAAAYARNGFNNGSTMSASNPVKIEMLVDYVIPEADKVTLDLASDNIIITTAKTQTAAQSAGESLWFEKTFNTAQGRLATDSDSTAILKRGDNGASLFTVNIAGASLSTEDIIFDGGAVYTKKTDGSYTITGITANTHGGFILGTKGAVTIKGGTTMRNSNVGTENYYGGAVYSPDNNGGAVITIENAAGKTIEFLNCTAGNGGAIKSYRKPLTVTNNGILKFVNCDARYGGALFTEYSGANISITNTGTMLFDDCDATSGVGGAVGAYTSTSNVTIINTSGSITFKDCSASSTGGAISANGAVSITGDGETLFSGCMSSSNGGGIHANGMVSITETGEIAFIKCSAHTGGAIYSGGTATLNNVTFGKANTADSGCSATDKGGCVYINSGSATITDCSFYYGKAGTSTSTLDAQGGGMCYYGSDELKILGGVFDHCSTESSRNVLGVGNGGAVYVDKNATKLTVDQSEARRSSFTECSAHRYGGAVHWERDGGTVEISNTDYTNCHSEIKGGGAVFTDSTTTTISNCSFSGCHSESTDSNYGGGGAIYTNADNGTATSTISVSDTTFSDCMVKKNGGAMQFNSTGTTATLTNVSVDGKKDRTTTGANAELGGAIYSKGNLTIRQTGTGTSRIENCSASDAKGGAVQVTSGKTMTFEGNVLIWNNQSTAIGQQRNVVLNESSYQKIQTTSNGLGTTAKIGVYVTGTMPASGVTGSAPFVGYGRGGDPFGIYGKGGSAAMDTAAEVKGDYWYFINDRLSTPASGSTPEKLIRGVGKKTNDTANIMYWEKTAVKLTIDKVVTGAMGDYTKEFSFTLTGLPADIASIEYKKYSTSDGTNYATTPTASGSLNVSNGSTEAFTLKHWERIVLEGLPTDTQLTLTETNGYYTANAEEIHTGTSNLVQPASGQALTVSHSNPATGSSAASTASFKLSADAEIKFTNNLEAVSPTGVTLTNAPYALMLLFGAMLLIIARRKKRA